MRLTLVLLALIVSLFCSNSAVRAGGDTPQPLGSDVVWYQDTTGNSPFKNAFQGMWYAPDGKIVVPQGNQLFLVDPETGKIVDKKKLPCRLLVDFMYSKNDNHLILFEDSTLYMYDLKTYELVKQFDMPEEFKDKNSDYFETDKRFATVSLSSDSKTIVAVFAIKNSKTMPVFTLNVETGEYKKIMEPFIFLNPKFSPNGKYFVGRKCDTDNKDDRSTIRIYDATTFEQIFDTKNAGMGLSNIVNSFSPGGDSLYISGISDTYGAGLFLIDAGNNYKLTNLNFPEKMTTDYKIINDSLAYMYYYFLNGSPERGIVLLNRRDNRVLYHFSVPIPLNWGDAYISPDKQSIYLLNVNYITKLKIPYNKITKTNEELNSINYNFTLAPNPTYDQVSFNLYLKQDQELTYSINTIDGKEVKKEYIGRYGAGQVSGSINLKDLNAGTYIFVLSDGANKLASGKISVVK